MKTGIVYVRKADMWLYYEMHNVKGTQDYVEWFSTKKEAEEKLLKEQNGTKNN